jgi:hypothetical protein
MIINIGDKITIFRKMSEYLDFYLVSVDFESKINQNSIKFLIDSYEYNTFVIIPYTMDIVIKLFDIIKTKIEGQEMFAVLTSKSKTQLVFKEFVSLYNALEFIQTQKELM